MFEQVYLGNLLQIRFLITHTVYREVGWILRSPSGLSDYRWILTLQIQTWLQIQGGCTLSTVLYYVITLPSCKLSWQCKSDCWMCRQL